MASTPFDRCGGFATVRKIVSAFYDKVLDSPRLQRHFVDVDMRVLIDHQTKFISAVMGGPASFSDDVIRRAHTRLDISHGDFEEMAMLLRETLEDFDLQRADIDVVDREIRKREGLVVSRAQ